MKIIQSLALIGIILAISSCGSGKGFESRNPQEVYDRAVKYYNDEDYLESRNLFEMIKLQYSATEFADDAQFYLGEIAYKRNEFVIAAFSFNQLRKSYPGSEYAKASLYKTGMSFYELSPKFDRDQDYTKKAIASFQEFQYIYPGDSLYEISGQKINELRTKLAYREFFTAELYEKLDSPGSSLIYYNSVISDYSDTEYYEPSYLGKIKVLALMERYDEAKGTIEVYKKLFPNGKLSADVKEISKTIK